MEENTEDVEGR